MTGRPAPWVLLMAIGVLVVAVDQASKFVALRAWDEPTYVLPGVRLSLSFNTGAAFSMGTDVTLLFSIAAAAVLAWIAWSAPRIATRAWGAAGGFIGGGAAGNLVDRLFRPPGLARGAVVDFIDVSWFASFNLADAALTVGAGLAVLLVWRNIPVLRARGEVHRG